MDNDKDQVTKNVKEDKNKNTEYCDETVNENLSNMEVENKTDDNSIGEIVINNLSMNCDNAIEKNLGNCDEDNNKIDSVDCKTDNEPPEKEYKPANVNGSLENRDNNVPNDNPLEGILIFIF